MKDWVDDLETHASTWSSELKKKGREWWPRYIYHFTDVQNAWSILNSGMLYSREMAQSLGLMVNDNANPEIIVNTHKSHLSFVRLYFRPQTPTQYNNEGIRQRAQQGTGHCPVPVFFLFDLASTIGRDDAYFSRGTMARSYARFSNSRTYFFTKIPFKNVYHKGAFRPEDRSAIIDARQAEVLFENELKLGPELKAICCRSSAERQTLLFGLQKKVRRERRKIVRVAADGLFERRYPYVSNVSGDSGLSILIQLSERQATDLDINASFTPKGGSKSATYNGSLLAGTPALRLKMSKQVSAGVFELKIEGCLAYKSEVLFEDLPF